MNKTLRILIACLVSAPLIASAQSGSSSAAKPGSGTTYSVQGSGSGSSPAAVGQPAMRGYCPVCLTKNSEWVAGKPELQAVFDGKVYRFPMQEALDAFRADPTKYVPVLGGDDLVTYARTGRRTPGKLELAATYLDHVYFFESEANRQAFHANSAQFANADVAGRGACPVCRVDMNANMAGNPKISATHNGLRYFFNSEQERRAFLANPTRYAAPPQAATGAGSGFRSTAPQGSGSGGSGSAGR